MPIADRRRNGHRWTMHLAGLCLATVPGCQGSSAPPSPGLSPIGQMERRTSPDPIKPLPGPETAELPPPPFADVPLVYQRTPEEKTFLEGYAAVGRPRLAVFVNRTLLGESLPVEAAAIPDQPPRTGADPLHGNPFRDEAGQPITYLRPGQYDEAYAKQIDYATIENVLTQWLACEGQTTIASPALVRERLTPEEINRLQGNRPRMLSEVAKELNADVLIYVQSRPTRQTEHGLEIRLNAEAVNVAAGEQIARATVLIPPPLDTEQVNKYTRFIARKLMADMAMTWASPGPARRQAEGQPGAVDPRPTSEPRSQPPVDPAGPEVAPPQPAWPGKPDERPPVPAPSVPEERPSLLDRPQTPTVERATDDDLPPPPASATRRPQQ